MILAVSATTIGCASYGPKDFPPDQSATEWPDTYSKSGFVLFAKLPEDERYQERYYDCVVTDYDVLPIEVFLENTSDDWTFDVRLSEAKFQLADGTKFQQLTQDEVYDELSFSYATPLLWLPFWILIFPPILLYGDISDANEALEDHLTKISIGDKAVFAKRRHHGVIFFRPVGKDLDECKISSGTLRLDIDKKSITGDKAGDVIRAGFTFEK